MISFILMTSACLQCFRYLFHNMQFSVAIYCMLFHTAHSIDSTVLRLFCVLVINCYANGACCTLQIGCEYTKLVFQVSARFFFVIFFSVSWEVLLEESEKHRKPLMQQ